MLSLYLKLFLSFMKIGLFSVGGGYAILPLIKEEVVELNGWLTLSEYADVITISQMTPGPISINAATFVGTRLGGLPGALLATLGCILPSCIIVTLLAYFYMKYHSLTVVQGVLAGLRPAVVAMIATACLSILLLSFFGSDALPVALSGFDLSSVLIFGASLFLLMKFRPSPIYVMLGAGVVGIGIYLVQKYAL